MSRSSASHFPDARVPTRASLLWLGVRIGLLRARRTLRDSSRPLPALRRGDCADYPHVIAASRTPLYTAKQDSERALELGKVQNLRVAARRLDGLLIPAGAVFSFWAQTGRCTRRLGYVAGRQLQEGCLVPALGGEPGA